MSLRMDLNIAIKMKTPLIAKTLLVVLLQTGTFLVAWTAMVSIARWQGRFPPELFFGMTTYYGTLWITSTFAICGVVAMMFTKPILRWCAICAGVVAWLVWLWPSFDSRPYAMPAFFALGALILTIGSGLVIPLMERNTSRENNGGPKAISRG